MQNGEKKVKKSFAQNTKSELKKVIWPTGKQTIKSTAITIGFVLLISIILVILNIAFDFVSNRAYNLMLGTSKDNEIVEVVSGDVSGELSGEVSGEISGEALTSGEVEQVIE